MHKANHTSLPFTVPPDLLEILRGLGEPGFYKAGTTLFLEGDEPKGSYLVIQGEVRLSLPGSEKKRHLTRIAKANCVLGLPGTITSQPYSLAAEVLEDSELIFVSRERLQKFLRENPVICFDVLQILAEEIRQMRTSTRRRTRARAARNTNS